MSEAWTDLVLVSRSDSGDATGPVRRLRSYLVDGFAANKRVVIYEDFGTMVIGGQACDGIEHEPLVGLKFYSEKPGEFFKYKSLPRFIPEFKGLSRKTESNAARICPEVARFLIGVPGKGYVFRLPALPDHLSKDV